MPIIMHNAQEMNHCAWCMEKKSSYSADRRTIIVFNTQKMIIMLNAWKINHRASSTEEEDDRSRKIIEKILGKLHEAKYPKSDWAQDQR